MLPHSKQEVQSKQLLKIRKWQKQLTAWTVTQVSSVTLGHPYLAYGSRISDRPFSEVGNFEGLSKPVLEKFGSCFPSCPTCPDRTAHLLSVVKARAISCPVTNFCHKEGKLHMKFQCPTASLK